MATTTRRVTAEELLRMPRGGFRYELVRGELRKMPPARQTHGEYALSIGASLRAHARANGLGKAYGAETGFKLGSDPDHVRAPDAAFVSNERLRQIGESTGFALGAPDLAVEVMSPNDRHADVDEKVADWLAAGNAGRRGSGTAQPYRQGPPLAGGRRGPGGIGYARGRGRGSGLADAGQGDIRVAPARR